MRVFHQGFHTPRNNKSTPPSASCFHPFLRRRSAFIVSRCLEPLMKNEARVFELDLRWFQRDIHFSHFLGGLRLTCDLLATYLRLSCDLLATYLRLTCDLLATYLLLTCDLLATYLRLTCYLLATYLLLTCDLAATYLLLTCYLLATYLRLTCDLLATYLRLTCDLLATYLRVNEHHVTTEGLVALS